MSEPAIEQNIVVVSSAVETVEIREDPERLIVSATGARGPAGPAGMPGSSERRVYGEGPPEFIEGVSPGQEYLDTLTGDLYVLE